MRERGDNDDAVGRAVLDQINKRSRKGIRHTHPGVLVREYEFPYESKIPAGFGRELA